MAALDQVPDAAERALQEVVTTGLLIEYTRCFGKGDHQLKAPEIFSDPAALYRHEEFVAVRSKHAAHDVNGFRDCHVAMMLTADGSPQMIASVVTQAVIDAEAMERLHALIDVGLEYVRAAIAVESAKIMGELQLLAGDKLLNLPDFAITRLEMGLRTQRRR